MWFGSFLVFDFFPFSFLPTSRRREGVNVKECELNGTSIYYELFPFFHSWLYIVLLSLLTTLFTLIFSSSNFVPSLIPSAFSFSFPSPFLSRELSPKFNFYLWTSETVEWVESQVNDLNGKRVSKTWKTWRTFPFSHLSSLLSVFSFISQPSPSSEPSLHVVQDKKRFNMCITWLVIDHYNYWNLLSTKIFICFNWEHPSRW